MEFTIRDVRYLVDISTAFSSNGKWKCLANWIMKSNRLRHLVMWFSFSPLDGVRFTNAANMFACSIQKRTRHTRRRLGLSESFVSPNVSRCCFSLVNCCFSLFWSAGFSWLNVNHFGWNGSRRFHKHVVPPVTIVRKLDVSGVQDVNMLNNSLNFKSWSLL